MNHHGVEREAGTDGKENDVPNKIIKVSPADLISRDEKVEFEARKKFYKDLTYSKKKEKQIARLQFVGKTIFPSLIISFSSLYFMYGFSQIKY